MAKSYKLITEINLDKCKHGDILIGRHGAVMKYIGKIKFVPETSYPHKVQFISIPGEDVGKDSVGTRATNGYAFLNHKLPTDQDVIAIIRVKNTSTSKKGE